MVSDLGYESSLIARSLRSHRTHVVGILVADIEPFSAELLKGAARAIKTSGYELIVYSGSGHGVEHAGWERRNVSRLSGTLTDGIILVTPTVDDLGEGGLIVAVDPHTGASTMPNVHADNLTGAITATDHLIDLGHRRIGFLAGRPDLDSARLREQGYYDALATAGIEADPSLYRVGGYELETSLEPARQLLELADPPTAIFAANDLSAIQTMNVARSLGLSVPDDVSVIGFDNIPESALTDPPLTTIDQSIQTMGEEAVRIARRSAQRGHGSTSADHSADETRRSSVMPKNRHSVPRPRRPLVTAPRLRSATHAALALGRSHLLLVFP